MRKVQARRNRPHCHLSGLHGPLYCASTEQGKSSIARIHDGDAAAAEAIAADRMMPRGARSEADTTRFAGSIVARVIGEPHPAQPARSCGKLGLELSLFHLGRRRTISEHLCSFPCIARFVTPATGRYQRSMIHFAPTTVCQTTAVATAQMAAASKAIERQDPILLEIGKGDQGNHQSGDDVAQGYWNEDQSSAQYHDEPTRRLVASNGCATVDEPPSQDI